MWGQLDFKTELPVSTLLLDKPSKRFVNGLRANCRIEGNTLMGNLFDRLPRHPRKFGFTVFNVAMVIAIVGWGIFTSNAASSVATEGLSAVPQMLIGYTGMFLLLGLFVLGWVMWTIFVIYHRRHRAPKQS